MYKAGGREGTRQEDVRVQGRRPCGQKAGGREGTRQEDVSVQGRRT